MEVTNMNPRKAERHTADCIETNSQCKEQICICDQPTHTPTPLLNPSIQGGLLQEALHGNTIAILQGPSEFKKQWGNHIVKCVNAHEELLGALREIRSRLEYQIADEQPVVQEMWAVADKAIAKAEGK